jgi:hypothetical protein
MHFDIFRVHRFFKIYLNKGDFKMKNIMNPVRSKKAVFQNNRYRHGKVRNQMFGRHDILKRFDVTEKRKSWKEEL